MASHAGLPIAADADDPIRQEVRARYAGAARVILDRPTMTGTRRSSECCSPGADDRFGQILYDDAERASLPDAAVLASLGCGNPTAVAQPAGG